MRVNGYRAEVRMVLKLLYYLSVSLDVVISQTLANIAGNSRLQKEWNERNLNYITLSLIIMGFCRQTLHTTVKRMRLVRGISLLILVSNATYLSVYSMLAHTHEARKSKLTDECNTINMERKWACSMQLWYLKTRCRPTTFTHGASWRSG